MRITPRQLKRIIMEEVSAANRQKRLQEARRRQNARRLQEKRRRFNRRRMMENAWPSFTHPKEQLIAAGIILAAAVAAGQLNKAFDLDGSQARKAAEEACAMSGGQCSPDQALNVARELLDAAPQSAGEDVPYEDDYDSGDLMSDPSSYSDFDY